MIKNIAITKIEPNKGQVKGVPKNPRKISKYDLARLKRSIEEHPEMLALRELIVYPKNDKYVVIGGNMRLMAAKELGYKELPCKVLDTDTPIETLRAYLLKDNGKWGEWDLPAIGDEWDTTEITEWAGVSIPSDTDLNLSTNDGEKDDEYNSFVDKFKPKHKLTTDDCYTPKLVYDAVKDADRQYKDVKDVAKLEYPDNLTTATKLYKCIAPGVNISCPRNKMHFVRKLNGTPIFGAGVLLADAVAAEVKAAAERTVLI